MVKNKVLENDTRREILRILVEDGRKSLVEIARSLGLSHVAVIKHIRRLQKEDVIKVQANVNPRRIGLHLVLVLLEVDEEALREILSRFKECPRIILLSSMVGGFNVVALMIAEDDNVLKCISTTCAIRILKGIRRSEIYILADLVKPQYLPIKLPFPKNKDKPPCGKDCSVCKMYVIDKVCLGCPATKYYKGDY